MEWRNCKRDHGGTWGAVAGMGREEHGVDDGLGVQDAWASKVGWGKGTG